MNTDIDLAPLLEHMEKEVMPEWVVQKDRKKEFLAEGKTFDSTVVEDLDEILELFYEKEYHKGLDTYISWLLSEDYPMAPEDIEMLIKYGRYFNIDSAKLNKFSSAYKRTGE